MAAADPIIRKSKLKLRSTPILHLTLTSTHPDLESVYVVHDRDGEPIVNGPKRKAWRVEQCRGVEDDLMKIKSLLARKGIDSVFIERGFGGMPALNLGVWRESK